MKVEYKGYVLDIEEVLDEQGNLGYYKTSCVTDIVRFIIFDPMENRYDLGTIITRFKNAVDKYLVSDKKKTQEEKEVPLFMQQSKYKEVLDKIVDKDAVLVNQFIAALQKVHKEMQEIDAKPNEELIRRVKLNRVFEQFLKQWLSFILKGSINMTEQIHYFNPPPDTTEQKQINLALRDGVGNIVPLIIPITTQKYIVLKLLLDKRKRRIYPSILFSSPNSISSMSYFLFF